MIRPIMLVAALAIASPAFAQSGGGAGGGAGGAAGGGAAAGAGGMSPGAAPGMGTGVPTPGAGTALPGGSMMPGPTAGPPLGSGSALGTSPDTVRPAEPSPRPGASSRRGAAIERQQQGAGIAPSPGTNQQQLQDLNGLSRQLAPNVPEPAPGAGRTPTGR